jgi:hypothetical protein
VLIKVQRGIHDDSVKKAIKTRELRPQQRGMWSMIPSSNFISTRRDVPEAVKKKSSKL